MIEGIEVLNKVPIMEMSETGRILISIAFFLLIATLVLFIIALATNSTIILIFTIISGASFIAIGIVGTHYEEETDRYEYQCTISDNVSFIDMHEKYKVVSKDGELWTIRDKEKE